MDTLENENGETYIRCSDCRCLRNEKDEFETYKGNRRKTCIICKENREKMKCNGVGICVHDKRKSVCKECGGSEICIHDKRKSRCIECGGSGICIHNKQKSRCKECSGSEICIHKRRKSECKECGGSQICIHNKHKSYCIECGGSQICIHNKQKSRCNQCEGSQICIHNKRKSTCKECKGSQICIHNRQKLTCKECSPQLVMINLVRKQVYRTFKNSNLKKINHSIEYLGCDTETLKEHFKKKMTDDMTFENIHIDHIKPVSRFNIEDEEEILKCCHFTNLQPLLCKDNLELNNKWTEENELFWNEHIIYKPEFDKLYKI